MSNLAIPSSNRLLIKPRGMFSIGGEFGDPNSITQNFNSYAPGVSLATLPGWIAGKGGFLTSTGIRVSSTGAAENIISYEPAGFTASPNHEVEVFVQVPVAGAASVWQGAAAAVQPDNAGYFFGYDGEGSLYIGYFTSGGSFGGYAAELAPAGLTSGISLRMSVKGSGVNRRVTYSYNVGAGWVIPVGWLDRDWGASGRFDGGRGGLCGFNGTPYVFIDSMTIRNLP